jgi:hypothetical protein
MSDASTATRGASWRRYLWWLVLLLLGILIGWWLAPRCPHCPLEAARADAPHAAPGQGGGDAARQQRRPDPGTPDSDSLSPGSGTADRGSGPGHDVGGISGPGPGSATGKTRGEAAQADVEGSDDKEPPPDISGPASTRGAGTDVMEAHTAQNPTLAADDFRYDKTGLPRYPQSVRKIASTLSREAPPGHGYHSTCAIVSSSSFQDVVDWYKANLPTGWSEQTVGDLNSLAQQVSLANITAALTAAAHAGSPTGTAAAGNDNAAAAGPPEDALSVAMFSPPPGMSGDPIIMIRQKAGQPVVITMSRSGT